MTKIKTLGNNTCWQGYGERGTLTPPLLVELQTGTTTLEINLEVPWKIGNRSTSVSYTHLTLPTTTRV